MLEIVEGALLVKDQIREYMDRGDELEQWSYLDFFLGTYDGKLLKNHDSNRGRPGNVRVPYQENCNRVGHCRILRSPGHDTMPYFPGRWFPKRDDCGDNTFFHASMLALLKPWRSLRDLKRDEQHFRHAFAEFMLHASEDAKNVVENIQFFHECADSARNHYASTLSRTDQDSLPENDVVEDDNVTQNEHPSVPVDVLTLLTEVDVTMAIDRPFSVRELVHADLAIDIGKHCGLLQDCDRPISYQRPALAATPFDMNMFDTWQKRLKDVANPNDVEEILPGDETGLIFHLDDQELNRDWNRFPFVEEADVSTLPPLPEVDASLRLNEKQMMVHDIVCSHLCASLSGACPPQ